MPLRSIKEGDVREIAVWNFEDDRQVIVAHREAHVSQFPDLFSPHRVTYYAIRWIVRGDLKTYIDHVPYPLSDDTLMIANPNQISWFTHGDQDSIEARLIVFTERFLAGMQLDSTIRSRLSGTLHHFIAHLSSEERGTYDRYFTLIEQESGREDSQRQPILSGLVEALLRRIIARVDDEPPNDNNPVYQSIYRDFLDTLERNFRSNHTVGAYADELMVTERKLSRVCQTIAGLSPGKIIQNRLDFEARRLLQYTSFSAKEIGYYLGFHDAAHFTKFFARHNGFSPKKYRQVQNV